MPAKNILGRCPTCCPGQPCEGNWSILVSGLTNCPSNGDYPTSYGYYPAGPLQPADGTFLGYAVNCEVQQPIGPPWDAPLEWADLGERDTDTGEWIRRPRPVTWCFVQPFPCPDNTTLFLGRQEGNDKFCVAVRTGAGLQVDLFTGSGTIGSIIPNTITECDDFGVCASFGGQATIHVTY